MENIVKLITGVAWPIAVVWIAYLFKGELQSLLHRVSQLKFKDVEARFDKGLTEAEAKVTELEKPSSPDLLTPDSEVASRLELLRRIADTSPRAAILEAWVIVEDLSVFFLNRLLFPDYIEQVDKFPDYFGRRYFRLA